MLVVPQAETAIVDPFMQAHTGDDLQHPGSDHPRGLCQRSAQCCPQSAGVHAVDRNRGYRQLRPRSRVLRLRRCPLRPERARRLLPRRQCRRAVESRTRATAEGGEHRDRSRPRQQCRLQHPPQGGLLPDPPGRHAAGPADRDDADAAGVRRRCRRTTPRGRDWRAVRDRHASTPRCCSTADNLLRYKYIVKNVAARHGKTATFMPKPLWNDNGSGLHLHFSLWKKGETAVRRLRLRRA